MGANNEARQQPFRNNRILIAEIQALRGLKLPSLIRLLIVQELRDQNSILLVSQREAQLELHIKPRMKSAASAEYFLASSTFSASARVNNPLLLTNACNSA